MASVIGCKQGVDAGVAIDLADAVEAAYAKVEAHRRAHENRVKGRRQWGVMGEARLARLRVWAPTFDTRGGGES